MTNIAIKTENLSKVYKLYSSHTHRLKEALHPFRRKYHTGFYAFKNINLTVKKSEIFGIVGRNGAGKSTLLKVISGVSPATEGHIWVNGSISALLDLGSGLNPEFTGIENIFFYGSILGFSKAEMEDRLEDILSFAEIGDFVSRPMKIYSKGMQARLAFAVAINIDPDILIVDEVLAVGDELFQRKCYAKIEKFMKEGVSILFVTHNVETINQLCTRAALIEKGELILDGPPKLVTTQYHRLLYANPEDTLKVRDEIVRLNKNEGLKKEVLREINKIDYPGNEVKDQKTKKTIEEKTKEHITQKAYYIPHLKPKSTVEYKNYDIEIYDIHIETLDGVIVNMLALNEEYNYSCKIKFNIDAKSVSFGMRFKSEKGLNISGAATHRISSFIKKVAKGEVYEVSCRFKCRLMPGTYFTNIGVTSSLNGELVYLNRIVDATIFRVQRVPNNLYAGLVHLDQKMEISKIK